MERRLGIVRRDLLRRAGRAADAGGQMLTVGWRCAGAGRWPAGAGSRPAAGGPALLAGSACTRFGIFRAGMASAEDPQYTVEPQRARLAAAR